MSGYEILWRLGLAFPLYSTLMLWIQNYNLNFRLLTDVLEFLCYKFETMQKSDKFCFLSYDEMALSVQQDYDKSKRAFVGDVILGPGHCLLGQ